ncbi:MAG: 5'/3'-nucleotidase SurE [Caldilineaceae bacterium]
MANILISNDDGVQSPGLLALKQALETVGNVYVLAPETNWSASGHSRTLDKPMRVTKVQLADGSDAYACNGSPADCVAMAIHGALEVRFDLVVGGINNGYNLANDISYSGTVSCAREAAIFNVAGIAVSTAHARQTKADLQLVRKLAADISAKVVAQVLEQGMERGILLNVNVPGVSPEELRGIEVTRMGWRSYQDELIRREDPYGYPYYWLSGWRTVDEEIEGTDVHAIANSRVSVTPIELDMTHYHFLDRLRSWKL